MNKVVSKQNKLFFYEKFIETKNNVLPCFLLMVQCLQEVCIPLTVEQDCEFTRLTVLLEIKAICL